VFDFCNEEEESEEANATLLVELETSLGEYGQSRAGSTAMGMSGVRTGIE
jgi:hypothetical protein